MLDQLSRDAGQCDLTAEETDVDCRSLPFYRRYKLYRLINRATLPAFSMHYLRDGEHFFALNGTANPIYTASEQDPLMLPELVVAVVVVVAFDRGLLDGAIHALDLPIDPGMIGLGSPMLDAVGYADALEYVHARPGRRAIPA